MNKKEDLEKQVMMAARDNGISSVLFRNAMGRKLGLNITDSECLSLLTIKGISTPTELAHYTGLTTGSTTAMLDRLEKSNYIKRVPNPKDRRGVLVEISKEYRQSAGPYVADLQQEHRELISSYSNKELKTIINFLSRFTGNVQVRTSIIEKSFK
jgi:DNA-binding MarR family transcriptional regulator